MQRYSQYALGGFLFSISVFGQSGAFDLVAKKYPGQKIVASCPGSSLSQKEGSAVVVYDTKLFRVLWIRPDKTIQILDTVPKNFGSGEFELSCKPAKEAEQFQKMANASEGIHVFLKLPKGNGMLCYFTSDTDSKCWTGGGKDGALVSAGGWQT